MNNKSNSTSIIMYSIIDYVETNFLVEPREILNEKKWSNREWGLILFPSSYGNCTPYIIFNLEKFSMNSLYGLVGHDAGLIC